MKYFLIALVFVSGMSSLAMEMCAARYLAAYFGTSIYTWTIIISLILLSLTCGSFFGGKLASAYPSKRVLCAVTATAALSLSLIPFVAQTLLTWLVTPSQRYILSIFIDAALFFSIPVALLGCVSPFAIRLSTDNVATCGRISGSFYAISTVGSILGAFLPILWLIPTYGVRCTILIFAVILLAASLWGLHPCWRTILLIPLITLAIPMGYLRAIPYLAYERESYYNYLQVTQLPDGTRQLDFDNGLAAHSTYNPKHLLTDQYWDDFLLAPYLNPAHQPPQHVCIIGLAGGTIARQFTQIYHAVPIDGVELDPAIVQIARQSFAMNEANLHVYTEDGRTFLATTPTRYDLIAIDAYQQFYVPFHLTTREFFAQIRAHLSAHGVVALNVFHRYKDTKLVQAFANTMSQVFPAIYHMDAPETPNTILLASAQPTSLSTFRANLAQLPATSILSQVAYKALPGIAQAHANSGLIFTDDRAPVEELTDQLLGP